MSHGKHRREGWRRDLPASPVWYRCETCGKRTYSSRKDAKRAARIIPSGQKPSSYECEVGTGRFHVGRLGQAVVYGLMTRDELYPRNDCAGAA